jgi:hypothetical protein
MRKTRDDLGTSMGQLGCHSESVVTGQSRAVKALALGACCDNSDVTVC